MKLRDNCACSEYHMHLRDLTSATLERALNEAISSYDNNRTWASGELVVEIAEAGGFMGSPSSYRNIDRQEFSERVLNALVAQKETRA